MSLGAIIFAPAAAYCKLTSASLLILSALSMISFLMIPQCPCEVYPHRQTSTIMYRSLKCYFISLIASLTGLFSLSAKDPCSSFCSEFKTTPKMRIDLNPFSNKGFRKLMADLYPSLLTPGILAMSSSYSGWPTTKIGRTNCCLVGNLLINCL